MSPRKMHNAKVLFYVLYATSISLLTVVISKAVFGGHPDEIGVERSISLHTTALCAIAFTNAVMLFMISLVYRMEASVCSRDAG